jgi:tRNA nucleotidyltransferase/poly(A) polymerase
VRERAGLARLSPERIRAELVRLLVADGAAGVVATMHDYGLLTDILGLAPRPSLLAALVACESTMGPDRDAMVRLSALCVSVEEDCESLAVRLRLSRAEQERLVVFAPTLAMLSRLPDREARARLYRVGQDRWRREMLAGWAMDVRGDAEKWRHLATLPQRWQPAVFPLRGEDIIAAGIAPGPDIGRILRRLETDWIAADFAGNRQDLLARLANISASLRAPTRGVGSDDVDT